MHLTQPPGYRLQRGITLIESLVAILVMAIGILGILGLQMRTLTDTQAGVRRAQAIRLIEDLGERLQNNPDALGNLSAYTATPTASDDCASSACAPDKLATYDIKQWRTSVSNALPGSQAIVFIPQGGPRQLGVLIGWNENRYNQNGQVLTTAEETALKAPLVVSGMGKTNGAAGDSAQDCPTGLTCHLQYIQPTQRCTPWILGSGELYCPN